MEQADIDAEKRAEADRKDAIKWAKMRQAQVSGIVDADMQAMRAAQ